MNPIPEPVVSLTAALSKLPGIGPRSAERIALHLVQTDSAVVKQLAEVMLQAREKIRFCTTCGALTEKSPSLSATTHGAMRRSCVSSRARWTF